MFSSWDIWNLRNGLTEVDIQNKLIWAEARYSQIKIIFSFCPNIGKEKALRTTDKQKIIKLLSEEMCTLEISKKF